MQTSLASGNRREFLASIGALAAAQLAGPVMGNEPAGADLKLGIDNFSIRAFPWKAPQLIEYAASLQLDSLLLSDLDVYESLEPEYLKTIRDQAERAGVELQAGTGSICPTSGSYNADRWGPAEEHARLLIRTAAHLGCRIARCYLGSRRDRDTDGGIARHIEETVRVLRAVRREAEDAEVTLAVENHAGDMQARELVELIEEAGTSFVGATIDSGNAAWSLEDPQYNLEILGPYVVTSHLRDTAIWEVPAGARCMWTNMGTGVVDWPAYVQRFRELCPTSTFALEIISYRWPIEFAYLSPDFWSRFPAMPAHEFARFLALAKQGRPYELPAGRPSGPESQELERAQQRFDLEQGIRYCREVLGIGSQRA